MQQTKKQSSAEHYLTLGLGALTYGAEILFEAGSEAAKGIKKYWDAHEAEREKIRRRLVDCKDAFVRHLSEKGKNAKSFDAIVASLDKLSHEELEKLKAILNSIEE